MMRASKINLHLSRKSALLCVVAFIATFLLLSFVVSIAMGPDLTQLNALCHSKYEYSATVQSDTLEDTYYQYNAGISFKQSEDSQTRFNAEVLMQTESGKYSNAVYWSAERLDGSCVAISKGIADRYRLSVGDIIYSKHITDGVTRAYSIKELLPSVVASRVSSSGSRVDGVIIMGYDALYATSISHASIIFTNEPIEAVAEKCSVVPTDILYRDDEIVAVAKRIAPYLILYVVAGAACVVCVVLLISKKVAHNFKRLAMNGAGFETLNNAFYRITFGIGTGFIIMSGIISVAFFGMTDNHSVITIPVLCAIIGELIALVITATASNKHLWRN